MEINICVWIIKYFITILLCNPPNNIMKTNFQKTAFSKKQTSNIKSHNFHENTYLYGQKF